MRKSVNFLFVGIFLSLVTLAVVYMFLSGGTTAKIYKEGKLVHTINLDRVEESYTLDIDGHNTVLIKHGAICMMEADCPDKLCVNQGEISDSAYPIVCLPNEVIIKIDGDFLYDSVSGK